MRGWVHTGTPGLAFAALVLWPALALGRPPPSDTFAAVDLAPGASQERALSALIERAARRGATHVVLPELALTGRPRPGLQAEAVPGPTTELFARHARRHRVWLAVPVLERAAVEGGYHVTTVLISPDGEVVASARRRRPRLDGADGAGLVRADPKDPLDSVDAGGVRLGLLSGEDLRMGVPRLAERGARVILVAASWGARDAPDPVKLCQALSREYAVTLVVAGWGHGSGVYRRDGTRQGTERGLALVTLDRPAEPVAAPLGLPLVPVPVHVPFSPGLVELGRSLFSDTGLSRDGTVSCATCHQPDRAFANGARAGRGVGGRPSKRNVPSLLNVGYRESLFWDGSSASLENLAKFPMSHAAEMDFHYLDAVQWVRRQPFYAEGFRALHGDRPIEFEDIARALAAYQRTLVSGDSPFDRFQYGGDLRALTPPARRGLELFTGKAGCSGCHTVGARFALFTDQQAHNTGVGYRDGFADLGRGALDEGSRQAGAFITPSLRNVALTAPYMHDGSLATLEDVVRFYDGGGVSNPLLDPRVQPLGLTDEEQRDLVEFLRALTGQPPAVHGGHFSAITFTPAPGALEENRRALEPLIRSAARAGARVVVLPEYAQAGPLTGLTEDVLARLDVARTVAWLAPVARDSRAWLSAPALERTAQGWRQVLVLLDDQGAVALVTAKAASRREWGDGGAVPGNLKDLQAVPTPFGRLALLSGDDLAGGVPRLARLGAETILISASWEAADVTDWAALARAAAREHRVNLVIASLGGSPAPVARGGEEVTLARPGVPFAFQPVAVGLLAPLGLPPVPVPSDLPAGAGCVELGRDLFFEPRLSRDGKVACATCHAPGLHFGDGLKVGQGVNGRKGHFNTPSLLNAAYRTRFFWDGRSDSLEAQVRHAVLGWPEMDFTVEAVEEHLTQAPGYRDRLRAAGAPGASLFETAARCIAAFERTLLSGNSPFDRFHYGGEPEAIGPAAREGFKLFMGKARCHECHTVGERWALFSDGSAHNTGVGYHQRFEYLGYGGDGLEGNLATRNAFRGEYMTPGLRDIARTAPYMHDGSIATLADVIDFYDRGGIPNPHRDPRLAPLGLTEEEKAQLVEFLKTLSSDDRPSVGEGLTP
jgi:cytochrome c peroxidase